MSLVLPIPCTSLYPHPFLQPLCPVTPPLSQVFSQHPSKAKLGFHWRGTSTNSRPPCLADGETEAGGGYVTPRATPDPAAGAARAPESPRCPARLGEGEPRAEPPRQLGLVQHAGAGAPVPQ